MRNSLFLPHQVAEEIHKATLRVLERTGVSLDNKKAESIYIKAGAKKDADGRILIPKKLVQECLEIAQTQSRIQMYNRNGEKSMVLKNGNTYFGPGSDALYNIDLKTLERRRSVLEDVKNNVTIADALPGFDFVMSMALPEDVDQSKVYATVFAEMIKHTKKPLVVTLTTLEDIKRLHRIASIAAEGEDVLKEKPFFVAYVEPISPLIMDEGGTNRLMFCAEHEIPVLYAAGANCGSGAPVTPEGGVVQGGAESLAGLVLAFLINEKARFIYGANTSAMDMRSTIVSYGDPIWFKTTAMYAELGNYYGLPSWGTAGTSDAFKVNAQAAMEAYEGISLAQTTGSTLVHDVGYLAHGELYDARMLVLTDMMIGRARHLMKPVDLSQEALAEHVIDEVARQGDIYVAHPHTANNFREALWIPPEYINRWRISDVEGVEFTELLSREVDKILSSHEPEKLPNGKLEEIGKYLDSLPTEDS